MKYVTKLLVYASIAFGFIEGNLLYADDAGRIFGLTAGGAAIGGLAGGGRGAGIGAATGLAIGLATSRRNRSSSSRQATLQDLRRDRRTIEDQLYELKREILAVEQGKVQLSNEEFAHLKRRYDKLKRDLKEIEDEINYQERRGRR